MRVLSGIAEVVTPSDFAPKLLYDRWGNRFLDEGVWAGYQIADSLFDDIGARRALTRGGFIHLVLGADVMPQGD